jgi:enoyl-CoA hydratase
MVRVNDPGVAEAALNVEIDKAGPVTTVTLSRPDCRNAVDPETARALYDAFVAFAGDPEARVAVLHGKGGAFCSGFDLKALSEDADGWIQQLHFGEDERHPPLGPMGPTRLTLSKPVIAAIAGPAVAGGMELALWCDLRIMERSAYMGVFSRRWGVPFLDGGTVRLPRLIGMGHAMDLVLTGRRVEADECLNMGLCNRVVADGEVFRVAHELAVQIAAFPNQSLLADRRSVLAQHGKSISEALEHEYRNSIGVLHSEAVPGARRFAEGLGRKGDFEKI